MTPDIPAYNQRQAPEPRAICDRLAAEITAGLPEAQAKVWHGGPVWFLNGNPVAGYWVRKAHVQLLFWSGQSFGETSLRPEGKFKAAEARLTDVAQIDRAALVCWFEKARAIQWDYKNLIKRRGVLEWLARPDEPIS
ncbi:DUF1801 domain-containing protein [Frigidibacter sp. SD6-1]|uniref:DUF1801 domain-containing protein n=1 Tax=Frigidibacter sp. SD6-1 TaxID=3032581 RepID=UPI0024E01CA9|nr:DUF1801 domain-containing protein [Frigidibacter sp. SD6-1]